ncbi:MAG: MFS transporter [Candidatus Hydrogenedens sp.]|nr:MFS transporter [Candidatus Hydrogenedens sp.]
MIPPWLSPQPHVTTPELRRGLPNLFIEGVLAWVMTFLTTGPLLIGFALLLNANNIVIGFIAAIGPMAQTMQLPAVFLVEKVRKRKFLAVVFAWASRSAWLLIAALPFLLPRDWVLAPFVVLLLLHFGLAAVVATGFNSWIRELVPDRIYGTLFGQRLAWATATGMVLSLAGGLLIDWWDNTGGNPLQAYSFIYAIGAVAGLGSAFFLMRVPEPEMAPALHLGFRELASEPVRDPNFRQLLIFSGWWSFATNFAAPFFAVYLLERIGLNMGWVMGLTAVSQLLNILFFHVWGVVADRATNKRVLWFTGLLFVITFLIWPFTTLPDPYALTIPLLFLIHIIAGVGTAGVNLCASNIALKLAPLGQGGGYVAMNAMVTGIAAIAAPIVAGIMADWLSEEQFSLVLLMHSAEGVHEPIALTTLSLQGLDFVFLTAFFMGLYALHRLLAVQEIGEIEDRKMHREVRLEMERLARQFSTAAGIRQLMAFPGSAFEISDPAEDTPRTSL